MKQMSNWSIVGIAIGIVGALGGFVRYFVIFDDTFRGIASISIGLLVCAVFYLYNQNLQLRNTLDAVEEYLHDTR